MIFDTQTFNSGFTKREFVVTTDDKYPQDVKFELIKDRTTIMDEFSEGDTVSVGFYIRGNEYQDRYYVNLQANKIDRVDAGGGEGGGAPISDSEPVEDAEGDFPF